MWNSSNLRSRARSLHWGRSCGEGITSCTLRDTVAIGRAMGKPHYLLDAAGLCYGSSTRSRTTSRARHEMRSMISNAYWIGVRRSATTDLTPVSAPRGVGKLVTDRCSQRRATKGLSLADAAPASAESGTGNRGCRFRGSRPSHQGSAGCARQRTRPDCAAYRERADRAQGRAHRQSP